jgi:hypothetical protein
MKRKNVKVALSRDAKAFLKQADRERRAMIPIPRFVLTDWREELDSALSLLLHAKGEGIDTSSVIAGVDSLVDRVMRDIYDFEEPDKPRYSLRGGTVRVRGRVAS